MDKTRQLRRAKDAMDRDWTDPGLDLDTVAAHAGYSRYHFVRAFKESYGETPGQYLTHRRIERAEELLRGADLSVTEICLLVGFSSLGTFSTRFKARTGLTPSEYRAAHVGRGASLIPGCYAMLWAGGFPRRAESGTGGPGSAIRGSAIPGFAIQGSGDRNSGEAP
ncbi:helix-turn-helix transcriptional regulator [Streptomyces sp. NPDC056716]|uniref:helix-turn-helix transcriptional regulator n=1 Tax=unclassified Streptomyces TaxID=2593676 RepID=UPI00368B836D